MNIECIYIPTHNTGEYRCKLCGHTRRSKYPPRLLHRACPSHVSEESVYADGCGPGCRLTRIINEYLGVAEQGGCGCQAKAYQMDRLGVEWCEQNTDVITQWMGDAAKKRGLSFSSRVARWVVGLAIRLTDQQRDPNAWERLVLAGIRRALPRAD